MIGDGPILCFGELLFRLSAPMGTRLMQTGALEVSPGGAEANVACGLARLGSRAAMASTLPANDLAEAMRTTLRGAGVDISLVRESAVGRMGLYFYTPGSVRRPAEVLYDRAHSSFALDPEVDVSAVSALEPAHIHVCGITPAVSAAASAATLKLLDWARDHGVTASFDGNYRAKLWDAWGGDGPAVLREILSRVQIAFLDWRDIALILGAAPSGDSHEARTAAAYRTAFEAIASLRVLASTRRRIVSTHHHALSAFAMTHEGERVEAPELDLPDIVDRIGAGDAFVAGFLHALRTGHALDDVASFALMCGAVKHGQCGDMPSASQAEIVRLLASGPQDVQR
jgi:2-dehydro-3-deoxygluconokinase